MRAWEETARSLAHPAACVALGAAILLLDLLTGRFLMFPILFVIPVVLPAWFGQRRLACALAVALPLGRLAIAALVEKPSGAGFAVANAAVRIAVLVLVALLVDRVARLTAELRRRVDAMVTVCAWSKTVEHRGEWLSFEEYLQRRFGVAITHGMSPAEAERVLAGLIEPAARTPVAPTSGVVG